MEGAPTPEDVEVVEQDFIRLFAEKGPDDLEVRRLLGVWTDAQESLAEQSTDRMAASIELNLRRARLYLAVGLKDEALENFEAAREQAHQINRDDLCAAIITEMEKNGF